MSITEYAVALGGRLASIAVMGLLTGGLIRSQRPPLKLPGIHTLEHDEHHVLGSPGADS